MIGPNAEELWLKERELSWVYSNHADLKQLIHLWLLNGLDCTVVFPDDAYYRVAILPMYNLMNVYNYICFLTCTLQ